MRNYTWRHAPREFPSQMQTGLSYSNQGRQNWNHLPYGASTGYQVLFLNLHAGKVLWNNRSHGRAHVTQLLLRDLFVRWFVTRSLDWIGNHLLYSCCLVFCIARSCCSKHRNTATGAFLVGSSEVFHDYLDLQCDFQYKAKPVYPKQKGERRSTTALLKTRLPFQEERGVPFKRQEIS